MILIPNQPFIIETAPGVSLLPSDKCRKNDDPGICPKYLLQDLLYLQFKRSWSEDPISCSLGNPLNSPELIANGSFDDADAGWTLGPNILITGGRAEHTTGATNELTTGMVVVGGETYRVKMKVTSNGGNLVAYVGNLAPGNEGPTISTSGDYSFLITNSAGFFAAFSVEMTGDITVDDISVRQVVATAECWDIGTGWEYNDDGVEHVSGIDTDPITLSTALVVDQWYVVTIKSSDSPEGYVLLKNGSTIISTLQPGEREYYFKATDTGFTINPSGEWSGTIEECLLYEVDAFGAGQFIMQSEDDEEIVFDMADYFVYENEYATLVLQLSELEGFVPGCYFFKQFVGESHPIVLRSNCFNVPGEDEETGCLRLIRAWCNCEGLGFNFHTFRLTMRLECDFSSPKYPIKNDTIDGTDGGNESLLATRGKSWLVTTEYVDEVALDCLTVSLLCDNLQVDGVSFRFKANTVTTEFNNEANNHTSRALFDLCPIKDIVYNRNAGCRNENFLLRVLSSPYELDPWNAPDSFKMFDRLLSLHDGHNVYVRIESIKINELERLSGVQYKAHKRSGLGWIPSDFVYGTGINSGISYNQYLNLWLNDLIDDEALQFFDDLAAVQYREDITFEVIIARRDDEMQTAWVRYKYTQEGRFVEYSPGVWTQLLSYVS